jgi:ubiquinone/menaquinone biosynthesis C-methylase UbiE
MNKLTNWSGERLETYIFNNNTLEHLHRYALAAQCCNQKVVLDIASGEGYGTSLLAKYSKRVFGVDIDENSVNNANEKYQTVNLEFCVGRADIIPFEDDMFDVIVSFETLEHHDKHEQMFLEMKRVLKKNGVLIISTPDKKNYTDARQYNNPFHVKELYLSEFESLVSSHFKNRDIFFQNTLNSSLIVPEKSCENVEYFQGDFVSIEKNNTFQYLYLIAIASDYELPQICMSIYSSEKVDYEQNNSKRIEFNEQITNARRDATAILKRSLTYRLGEILLCPFKYIFRKFMS